MTEKESFVSKFPVQDRTLLAIIDWKNEEDIFHIKLIEDGTTWSGRFSREFAQQFRNHTDESEEEYCLSAKKGLMGSPEFVYELESTSESSYAFSWKKQFSNSISLIHGTVPLHKEDIPDSNDVIVDFLYNENKNLKNQVCAMKEEISELTQELDAFKNELQTCVLERSSFEQSLYGKFVLLLNTKKHRIRILENALNAKADELKDNCG